MNPLTEIDRAYAPLAIAANKLRQVRDSLPTYVWAIVPPQLRTPIDLLFKAVEETDRRRGVLIDLGLLQQADGSENHQAADTDNNG